MSSYSLTKARVFQYVGILFALALIAAGYWYWSARAGVKSNTSASQPQGVGRLDSGLAGYWAMDNGSGTTATDASTNGNNGTLTNGPAWTTGQIGSAVSLDGVDDYVSTGTTLTSTDSITLSAWVKGDTPTTDFPIFGHTNGQAGSDHQCLFYDNGGTENLYFSNGGGGSVNVQVSGTGATLGTSWHHVVYTNNGTKNSLYLDGIRLVETTSNALTSAAEQNLEIGRCQTGGGTFYFDGLIDEARVYRRALSADEISQLYRLTAPTSVDTSLKGYWSFDGQDISGTTAYDRSGTGNNLTLTGSPTPTGGPVGQALSFSGSNNVSVTPGGAGYGYGTSDFSVSVWAKTNGYVDRGSAVNVIVGRESSGSAGYWYGILFQSDNKPYFSVGNGTATSGAMAINDNQWHHFTGIRRGSVVELWIDGVKMTDGSTTDDITHTGVPFYLGSDAAGTRYFTGSVDEPRVYNRALSASEIKSLYDSAKPDATNSSSSQAQGTGRLDSGLSIYWKFDEGSGSSVSDASTNGKTMTANGMTWTTGQIGGAGNFDGTNDNATVTNTAPTLISVGDKVTTSVWYNSNQSNGTTGDLYWVSNGGCETYGAGVTGGASTDTLGFYYRGTNCSGIDNYQVSGISKNTWHHVVSTYDTVTGAFVAYVDGVQRSSGMVVPTATISYSGGSSFTIGSHSNGSQFFTGAVDEFRIYRHVLSPDEVGQLYRLTSPTSVDTSLKGYWSFNGKDLSGTTAYDRSGLGSTGTLTNGPTTINGIVGQGLSFDGVDDYVESGLSTPYQFANTTFSVTGWFKSSPSATGGVFVAQGGAGGDGGWLVGLNGDTTGKLVATLKNTDGGQTSQLSVKTGFNDNNWHQFVFIVTTNTSTYTGNSLVIYADGVLQSTTANSDSTSGGYGVSGRGMKLGARNYGVDASFTGGLDEVRIYNRALTAAEIQGQYEAVKPDKTNSSATQPQGVGRLDSGLAGYWKFDDGSGTTVTDSSTNGNNGTLANGPTWTTGQIGGGVSLDGVNDAITVSAGTGVLDAKQNVTLSAWVYFVGINSYNGIIYKSGAGGCDEGTAKYMLEVGLSGIQIWMGGTTLGSSVNPPTGQWSHIVATNSAAGSTIYLNGALIKSGATLPTPSSSSTDWSFGSCNQLNGSLDEVRIYDRALSADEVSQLYRLGTPTGTDTSLKGYWSFNGKDVSGTTAYDRSGMGNNGTLTNGPTVTNGKLGQALTFDGSSFVNITSMSSAMFANTTFTVTGWFKTASDYGYIIDQDLCDGGWSIGVASGYLGVSMRASGSCGAGGAGRGSTTRVDDNKWHHFVAILTTDTVTAGNNSVTLYVDGVLNQGALTTGAVYGTAGDSKVQIGARYSGFNGLLGPIDEVRIYNRELTAAEVLGLYNQSR